MMYAVFSLATGEIRRVVTCRADLVAAQFQGNEGALAIDAPVDDGAHYISGAPGGVGVVERPRLAPPPEAMAIGAAASIDLPAATRVEIDGVDYGVTDGAPLELSFAVDGVYRVEFAPPFPFQPLACDVTVSAP